MRNKSKLIWVILCFFSLILITSCDLNEVKLPEEVQKNVENIILSDVPQQKLESFTIEPKIANLLSNIQVYFINVGQGDSTLIVTPNKKAILIDAGNYSNSEKIISKIKELGIKMLDLVIATNSNTEHIGGMQKILETFNTLDIIMPSYVNNLEVLKDLLGNQENGITQAKAGQKIVIDDVEIKILAVDTILDDSNNSSILLRVDYNDISILFTSDLEEKAENIIINQVNKEDLSADILKVGHHGSDISTSDDFLDLVSPKMAVISVGTENLPSTNIIDKLLEKGILFYRTDEDGTVELEIDGVDIVTILSSSYRQIKPQVVSRGKSLINLHMEKDEKDEGVVNSEVNIAEVVIIEQVYIVDGDDKFHRNGCELLNGSTKSLSIIDAEIQGFKPCEYCFK